MNLETLKNLVAADPHLSPQCFIITWTPQQAKEGDCCPNYSDAVISWLIRSVFGEDVKYIEFISKGLVLVTIKDSNKLSYMLASVNSIWKCIHKPLKVVPVAPLPARVEVSVQGIPQQLINTISSDFLSVIAKEIPALSHLRLLPKLPAYMLVACKYSVKLEATSLVSVEGVTSDLVKIRNYMNQGHSFTFQGFIGKIDYFTARPVDDEGSFKPGDGGGLVGYHKWFGPIW